MIDPYILLAEGAAHASEGLPPYLVAVFAFVILMALLGITYLASGLNQPKRAAKARSTARVTGERTDH